MPQCGRNVRQGPLKPQSRLGGNGPTGRFPGITPILTALVNWWRRRVHSRRSPSRPRHLITGEWGEREAEKWLVSRHYRIVGRRVKVGLRDELDLIAHSPENVLVFIEVKTRADETFGRPFAAVNARKRNALSRAAWRYLKKLRPKPNYFRFDVVEVIGAPDNGAPKVRHIENAFSLLDRKRINW